MTTTALTFVSAVASGNHAVAIKLLDAAIKNESSTQPHVKCALHVNRGVCNSRLQLYRKALKDFDEALACNPHSVEALYHKGVVLVALKKTQEAEQTWQSALALATLGTDLHLIAALQAALRCPAGVLWQVDPYGYLWAWGTRRWVLALVAVLVAACSFLLLRHSFQVASGIAAAGSIYSSNGTASSGTAPSSSSPTSPPAPSVSQPATPPNAEVRHPISNGSTSPHTNGGGSSTSTAAPGTSTAGSSGRKGGHGNSNGAKSSPSKSGDAACSSGDGVVELDCAAMQEAARGSGMYGGGGASSSHSQAQPAASKARAWGKPANNGVQHKGKGSPATASAGGRGAGAGGSAGNTASALGAAAAIQLAVTQINAGNVEQAETLLDGVLEANPNELGARVARGTARALRRELVGAIEDFSAAIDIEPRYADTWKRRGQARSALGESQKALTDLQKAIDLLPMWGEDTSMSRAECYVEKGLIHQKARDYRRATDELKQAVRLDPTSHQAWNLLGLSFTSQGELRDGVRAYEKAVEIKPDLKEAWFNMAQARKEAGLVQEAEAAFARLLALEEPGKVHVAAHKIMAQMKQQGGEHVAAVALLDKAIQAAVDEQAIELLFLRAICHHALGQIREAARDYDACLTWSRPPGTSALGKPLPEETRQFQFLSWYQREMALYLYQSFDRRADSFCPDAELPALFKESWCKKGAPGPDLISQYQPQRLPPASPRTPPPPPDPAVLKPLTQLANQFGHMLQNQHQGFMSNVRQQRAAGFAVIELAQSVRALIASKRAGRPLWVRSEGSSVHRGAEGRHEFGWRDAMDIVVKWRQLAEPNDQVVWVDLLTRREFEQGFGSHTPIFSGQTKCVRYYMNFDRALALHKQVLLREGHAFDAQNRRIPCGGQHQQDNIKTARTAEDMYAVLKSDTWVVVPIASLARPGHMLEGTRLTLVKVPNQPDAYEFSIRTPVTPPRWQDFDQELEAAWEGVVSAMIQEPMDYHRVAHAILTYAYYWYNFMPLARGTAACGYTTIISLFWAAGMPVTARIPKDYQVDWEAILSQHADAFIQAVSTWLLPPMARPGAADTHHPPSSVTQQSPSSFPDVGEVARVNDHIGTIRQRLEALNPESVGRLQ